MRTKRQALYLMFAAAWVLALVPIAQATCRRVIVHHHKPAVVVEKVVAVKAAIIELVTPVLPIYIAPPAYGAIYAPPQVHPGYAPPAQAPHALGADPCADLRIEFNLLKQRLLSLEGGGRPGVAPPLRTGPEEELRLLQQRLEDLKRRSSAPQPMSKADNGNGDTPGGVSPAPAGPGPSPGAGGVAGGFVAFAGKHCASCHDSATAKLKGGGFTLLSAGKVAELKPEQAGETIRRLALPDGHPEAMPKNGKLSPAERLEGIKLFVEGGS